MSDILNFLKDKTRRLLFFTPLFYCLWAEIIFSVFLKQGFTVHKLLFSLTWGLFMYWLGQITKNRALAWRIQTVPAGFCTAIYCAQVAYYTLFETPFYLRSISGAGETMSDFFGVAVDAVRNVAPAFALILAGFIFWVTIYRKTFVKVPYSRKRSWGSVIAMTAALCITFSAALLDYTGAVSPSYMLLYEFVPTESVRTFGMLATEFLDVKYNILHLSATRPETVYLNMEDIVGGKEEEPEDGHAAQNIQSADAGEGASAKAGSAQSSAGTSSSAVGQNTAEADAKTGSAAAASEESSAVGGSNANGEDENADGEAADQEGASRPEPKNGRAYVTEDQGHDNTNVSKETWSQDEYNVLENIDFSKELDKSEDEQDPVYADMNSYFSHRTPSKKNAYTGMFKGKNLILITAEAFSKFVIDPELTPTLYKMQTQGFQFHHFYTGIWGVSTSDGEFVATTSLIPKAGTWSYTEIADNYMPFAFGNQFRQLGYLTQAFHDHSYTYYNRNLSYPNMGYDFYAKGHGLNLTDTWPESDNEMMEQSVDMYADTGEPFHVYYMTVSGHLEYTWATNQMAQKHRKEVENSRYKNCSEQVQAYVACQLELEDALTTLIKKLDEAGVLDNTVIALSPDHYPYGLTDAQYRELRGQDYDSTFGIYDSTFLIWNSQMKEPVESDAYCSSLDIAPTLSNLFGLKYDSRLFMGTDIFGDVSPVVCLQDRSFITGRIRYDNTNEVATSLDGGPVSAEYLSQCISDVKNRFYYSSKIIDTDYYRYLLG